MPPTRPAARRRPKGSVSRTRSGASMEAIQSASYLGKSRLPGVPVGRLLVSVGGVEDSRLVERAAGDLEPDGESVDEAAGDGDRRQAGQVRWRHEAVPGVGRVARNDLADLRRDVG